MRSHTQLADMDSISILGSRVDCADFATAVDAAWQLIERGTPAHVVTFGAEMAVYAAQNADYRAAINAADLVVADTVGVATAMRAFGALQRDRVPGIELAAALIARCAANGLPVYLLGGAPGVAQAAARTLTAEHPGLRVAGARDGYFPPEEEGGVARDVRASGARLVLVGLGFPKQELFVRRNFDRLGDATFIGVGGSFDVWSGRVARAPEAWRRAGLEWLYRLASEPHRWRRQMALPSFAARVAWQKLFGGTGHAGP